MSLVACKEVGQALIKWLDAASEKQRETLCDALGCDNGVSIEDLLAALQDCKGEPLTVETAIATCEDLVALYENSKTLTHGESGLEVKISEKEGNSLSAGDDGLFAEVPEPEPFVDCSGKEIESGSAMVTCENLRGIFDESETIEWEEGKAPEVKLSEEEGNGLEVKGDGLFAKAGGDICGAFDELPVRTTFGEKPRMIINDGDECFVVEVSPSGVFSDIRAGIQASPATAIAGDTGRVSFIARNVSSTEVSKVRLIATLPAQARDELGYEVVGEPAISNPTGATITKVGEGVWDIEPMVGGAVVTVSYTLKYLKDGTYMFSSTVEMLDENAVDFDEADDYASAGVVVRLRENPNVDPEQCPAMDVRAEVDGVEYPMTLIQPSPGSSSVYVPNAVSKNPKSIIMADWDSEVIVKTAVPVTIMNPSDRGYSAGAHYVKDGVPYGVRYASNMLGSPETGQPNPDISVEASPDAKTFRIKATKASARGGLATLAIRPNDGCLWQHFVVLLGEPLEKGMINVSEGAPPFTKANSFSPAPPEYVLEAANGGTILASRGITLPAEINPSEEVLLKPKTGQAYSFNVKAVAPAELGFSPATGNITIEVVDSMEWNVTINPTASSADNIKIGPLTFEFED